MNNALRALHGYLYGMSDDSRFYADQYRRALCGGDKPAEIVDHRGGGFLKVLALNCANGTEFRGGYVTELDNGDEVVSGTTWLSDSMLRRCLEATPVPE